MQLQIDFELGLTEQYSTLEGVCAAAIYGASSGLKRVAAACDCSPSLLSKMLSGANGKRLPAKFVPIIIRETADNRPVHWLVETFLRDPKDQEAARWHRMDVLSAELSALASSLRPAKAKR